MMMVMMYAVYVGLGLVTAYAGYTLVRFVRADADLTTLSLTTPERLSSLAGQRVWVTGASYGIGASLASVLASHGAHVVLSARSEDKLAEVASGITGAGGVAHVLPLDLLDRASHSGKAEAAVALLGGGIDMLVNNGGRSQRALVEETPVEVDEALLELNVVGTISLTKAVLPHMVAGGGGVMAVTSSVAGKMPVPVSASYAMSKAAIGSFFHSMGTELADKGIHTCVVCPGPVVSEGAANAFTATPGVSVGVEAAEPMKKHKMSTLRCAQLYAGALAGRVREAWISEHPVLLYTYAAQYAPSILRALGGKMAAKRVAAFRKGDMGYGSVGVRSFLSSLFRAPTASAQKED